MRNLRIMFCVVSIFISQNLAIGQSTEKFLDHKIGLQVNQLIRQIINLNATNATINNPFLLNYSTYMNKNNWGLQLGFGYDYQSQKNLESTSNDETSINDLSYRVGVSHRFHIGEKLYATMGLDFVQQYLQRTTISTTVVNFSNGLDSTIAVTKSIDNGKGGGLQVQIGWNVTKRISIHTEATFYYMKTSLKDHTSTSQVSISTISQIGTNYNLTTINSDLESSDFNITVPLAIFINVRF